MVSSILNRIRRAVRSGRYIITDHALEEAGNDDLLVEDIIAVLLAGDLDAVYTDDPRGTRYVVRGEIDRLEIDVVCRFQRDGILLIVITVYLVD